MDQGEDTVPDAAVRADDPHPAVAHGDLAVSARLALPHHRLAALAAHRVRRVLQQHRWPEVAELANREVPREVHQLRVPRRAILDVVTSVSVV